MKNLVRTAVVAAAFALAGCGHTITAPPVVTPSALACATSSAVLSDDITLDTAAETTSDPATYVRYVAGWKVLIAEVHTACAGGSLTAAEHASAAAWLVAMTGTHVTDETAHPTSYAWDRLWIARYAALTRFFRSVR